MQGAASQLSLFQESDEPDPLSGFSVRESGRARRLSIKVYPRGRVEVVVPKRTNAKEVRDFVESHREWIDNARAQFAAQHEPEPFALPDIIRLDGIERIFGVRYIAAPGAASVGYRTRGSTVVLTGAIHDESKCVAALKRWLTSVAKKEYGPRMRALSLETGNPYKKISVRGQRTCWGSHSSSGTVSLNYCLMFLEPVHLRYVMVHELCHARHMNHSRAFWRHVSEFEPQYRKIDKSLNECWKRIPTWVGIY